jgi:hypothetical protein
LKPYLKKTHHENKGLVEWRKWYGCLPSKYEASLNLSAAKKEKKKKVYSFSWESCGRFFLFNGFVLTSITKFHYRISSAKDVKCSWVW